ncbi:MAG: hypothetical protein NVS3B10_14660 [Polyangiales bacterium]
MSRGIWVRCDHCGVPHPFDLRVCPTTGRAIEPKPLTRASPPAAPSVFEGARPAPYAPPRPLPRAPSSLPSLPNASTATADEAPRWAALADAPPSVRPESLVGRVLDGKYKALRVIGAGAMGFVVECEHLQLRRRVAVKVLHSTAAAKPVLVKRFRHEARILGALGHPNVCAVFDIGELSEGLPFLVMELLEGETLADRIDREGQLPLRDTLDVIAQICGGLAAAHENKVIHRDVKPENVFLVQRPGVAPTVKVIDFGISKIAEPDHTQLTHAGKVMGSPAYMAPEQTVGDAIDARVDVYATGVVMYECLTGRRPFEAHDIETLLRRIQEAQPPSMRSHRPDLPGLFERVVERAMSRDLSGRYADALELQRDVLRLRAGKLPLAASVGAPAIDDLDGDTLVDDPPTAVWRPGRRPAIVTRPPTTRPPTPKTPRKP